MVKREKEQEYKKVSGTVKFDCYAFESMQTKVIK